MLLTYRLITAFLALLVAIAVFRQRSAGARATGAMVLVPLLLRLLLVK